tara:strand:- start:8309 stop:9901 length:1593 start_codon:yes stop_codon:yes gene_type:complete
MYSTFLANLKKREKIFYFIILLFFSISFNQYYGNLGVCPIDSFWFFNSGYDVLNGHYPFKDYWTISGPFIAYSQALLFKIFGVSWFSYVFHASIFNFLISITTFYTFYKLKLNVHFCFFYALLVSILAYPSAGTPFVEQHASIISIISIYCFILALKTNSKIYWFLLPIFFLMAFLTKQTPTGYIFLIIGFLSIIYFIFNFDINKIIYGILGSAVIISIFLIVLFASKISLISFYDQYISFPLSIGKVRYDHFLFPLEFSRIFLRYKLIHLSSIILIIVSIKSLILNLKYLKNNEFLITLSLIGSSYALIAHQLMTVNGIFIYFIIPILAGFSHIYYLKHFNNKTYILYFLIFLTFSSTAHYGYKYIHKRDFMDLRKVKMENAVDAKILDNKLRGLKWISCLRPNDPKKEISQLLEVIDIIKKDKRNKSIITDYQFISVILSSYDFSPSQVWFINHVVHQDKKSKYFKKYKQLLINQLKENKIKIAYVIKPLWQSDEVFETGLSKNCIKKIEISEILDGYLLLPCEELKN